ncbi:hypothetical protein F5888DRAFT_1221462 [Russula emetica]|nr:hypothetical protein F5888DRAFT_1221462 [Russula emetica]
MSTLCPHSTVCTPKLFPHTCTSTRAPCLLNFLLIIVLLWQDHAFACIGAGTAAVPCMNPLSTRAPGSGGIGRGIWLALSDIHASEGWRGLYRGLGVLDDRDRTSPVQHCNASKLLVEDFTFSFLPFDDQP